MCQHQEDLEQAQVQLSEMKQRSEADKEALKKATRAMKQRAARNEDTSGQLQAKLTEMVRIR